MTSPAIRPGQAAEIDAFLAERIYEYNAAVTGYRDFEPFGATRLSEAGSIEAGVSGFTWGGCCYVAYLWVAPELRGNGVGSELLSIAEQLARSKGCRLMVLSSHSFQAPGFYTRKGYEQVAQIVDYPVGHSDFFLAKRLASMS